MALDLEQLAELAKSGPIVRILVADHKGSVPRETGCSMLSTADAQFGTIGGGALEYLALECARKMIAKGEERQLKTVLLGPALSQCCGGSVKLAFELFDRNTIPQVTGFYARPFTDQPISLRVAKHLRELENGTAQPGTKLIDGHLFEGISQTKQPLWIYGAGHVGRAIIDALSDLPFAITWVDTSADRYPDVVPDDVTTLIAKSPALAVKHAPIETMHLVLTYSHTLDLEICNAVLSRNHMSLGLIGSKTKHARFIKRLMELGHSRQMVDTLICPIGDPSLGKHPKAIAIGVARELLRPAQYQTAQQRNI